MSASELLKECLAVQNALEFVGFGTLKITLHIDASVARAFIHRRGVGRMKHLDVRFMWLQDLAMKNVFTTKKIDRNINPGDMLTHPPAAADVKRFREMLGLFEFDLALDPFEKVKAELVKGSGATNVQITHRGAQVAALMLMAAKGVKADESALTGASAALAGVPSMCRCDYWSNLCWDVCGYVGVIAIMWMMVMMMISLGRRISAALTGVSMFSRVYAALTGESITTGELSPNRRKKIYASLMRDDKSSDDERAERFVRRLAARKMYMSKQGVRLHIHKDCHTIEHCKSEDLTEYQVCVFCMRK